VAAVVGRQRLKADGDVLASRRVVDERLAPSAMLKPPLVLSCNACGPLARLKRPVVLL